MSKSISTERYLRREVEGLSRETVEAEIFQALTLRHELEDKLFVLNYNLNQLSYQHNRLRREAGEIP